MIAQIINIFNTISSTTFISSFFISKQILTIKEEKSEKRKKIRIPKKTLPYGSDLFCLSESNVKRFILNQAFGKMATI